MAELRLVSHHLCPYVQRAAVALAEKGVPFERSYFAGKAVYLLTSECLMWTGNEKAWPFNQAARPAPRGRAAEKPLESFCPAALSIVGRFLACVFLPQKVQ